MSDPTLALQTEHLAKTYVLGFFRKKVQAVRDVSIEVKQGQIFGLLGPNGAGKTTTLKVCMGLVRPTKGTVQVLGHKVGNIKAKQRLGYLPETPYFYDYLTGRELLVFMAKLFDLGRVDARRRADELLEQVGLTRSADLALRRYSKGMLQRVGLAQALINDPELVILDEPLTGLDPLGRRDLRKIILQLREAGKTVVLSSHILSDVEMLADLVAIVVRGRMVSSGPLHELLNARIVSTEVVLADHAPALLAALEEQGHTVTEKGEKLQVVIQGDAPVDPVLKLAYEHDARVFSVSPRKESLEDVVIGQVKAEEE